MLGSRHRLRLLVLLRSIHVGVVGSGPAAFYTTKYLLRRNPTVHVDMIERLPIPFGLVRYGVAPDHPETKNVIGDFQHVLDDDRCRFIGNVEVDRDVSVEELMSAYDAVVIACGAAAERSLDIPGEHLTNSVTARAFVNWYNGHPDHRHDLYDLAGSDAVIIGNGNVALDVGRILSLPRSSLEHTDIAESAYQAIAQSQIERVHVVGRRGAPQASFSNKELREIVTKQSFDSFVIASDIDKSLMNATSVAECNARAVRRKMQILSQARPTTNFTSAGLYFRFNLAPVEIVADPTRPDCAGSVVFERTRLQGDVDHQFAVRTGEFEIIKAGLIIRSVGYRSSPFKGVPFDYDRGIIPSEAGRVVGLNNHLYVAGWIKRGPSGIIGSNIADASETVTSLLEDVKTETSSEEDRRQLRAKIERKVVVVDNEMWRTIDKDEIERGRARKKPREKYLERESMIGSALGKRDHGRD